jgi:hypothetical protein
MSSNNTFKPWGTETGTQETQDPEGINIPIE